MSELKHPLQPIYLVDGIRRFKANPIVAFLLETSQYDLNDIVKRQYDDEDMLQFMQLLGISVSAFSDLNEANSEIIDIVNKRIEVSDEKDARIAVMESYLEHIRGQVSEMSMLLFNVDPADRS